MATLAGQMANPALGPNLFFGDCHIPTGSKDLQYMANSKVSREIKKIDMEHEHVNLGSYYSYILGRV